ncbi:MAG: FAD-dependent oxidoreductase [Desulfomonilaceae bacterium]
MNLLIIGGSDAGISAALRAIEINRAVNVKVVLSDSFPNYSICGLPFYLSGETPEWSQLAHRKIDEIEKHGIRVLINHHATSIDPRDKTVTCLTPNRQESRFGYDKLILATGAVSAKPPIVGLDQPGVYLLRWMEDGFAIDNYLKSYNPKSALIVGGGYIGMEMADSLNRRGLAVTVVEYADSVMETVDKSFGAIVRAELERRLVQVVNGVVIEGIERTDGQLFVYGGNDFQLKTDMVLVATGCQPRTDLAIAIGVATGAKSAIKVNRRMETSFKDIYAAGDCVETWRRIVNRYEYLPLGTTAHKQGRVAGANAVGGQCEFSGSLGTQVVKIFNLVVGRTGLRQLQAAEEGFDAFTEEIEVWDHKAYYPGATKIKIRITGDKKTGKLLGAQVIGAYGSEISKRIDVFATALFHEMTVDELSDVDLSYTPPLSSPWDPVQIAAQEWMKKLAND